MPTWTAISFQDACSPAMEQLIFFHDHAMIVLILITVLTMYIVLAVIVSNVFNNYMIEGQEIETVWTLIPAVLLIFIAFPSMNTLYLIEDTNNPSLTVNAIGHQWYWSYEYTGLNEINVDSFIESSNLSRLLNVSEPILLPALTSTRIIITSADVIHSWAVPSIGVNVDAIPGRINQTFITAKRVGLFSGQCSEICGTNHSFIPILVNVVTANEFIGPTDIPGAPFPLSNGIPFPEIG